MGIRLSSVSPGPVVSLLHPASSEAAAKSAVMNLVFMALFRFFCLLLFGRRQGYSDTFYKAKREPITNSVVEHVRIMEVETQAADVRTSRP